MSEDELRSLLEQAEEVGCFRQVWREAVEHWEECGKHPYYEREMQEEELYYREARKKLYDAAGIPEEQHG